MSGAPLQKDAEKPSSEAEKLSPAHANPILQNYFLRQYNSTHGLPDSKESPAEDDHLEILREEPVGPMAERHVQWQIKRFLEELNKEADALKAALADTNDARLALRDAAGAGSARQAWKQTLIDVSQHAGKLSRLIGNVLADLETDRRFKAEVGPAASDLLEKQSALLQEEAEKALIGVKALFFEPTNVVGIAELKGENVLAHLNRVEKLSQKMSEALGQK